MMKERGGRDESEGSLIRQEQAAVHLHVADHASLATYSTFCPRMS